MGRRFFNTILKAFENIKKAPNANPKIGNGIRKHVVKKFPFVILYVLGKTVIKVIAVFHTSRNPDTLEKRMEDD